MQCSKRKQREDPAVAGDPELMNDQEPNDPPQLEEFFDQNLSALLELMPDLGDAVLGLPNQPGSSAQHAAQPPPDPMEQDEPPVYRSTASRMLEEEAEDDEEEGEAPQYRSLRGPARANIEAIRASHPLLSAPSKLPQEKKMDLPIGAAPQAHALPAEKEGEQEADAAGDGTAVSPSSPVANSTATASRATGA